jgi:hypothetical protein
VKLGFFILEIGNEPLLFFCADCIPVDGMNAMRISFSLNEIHTGNHAKKISLQKYDGDHSLDR